MTTPDTRAATRARLEAAGALDQPASYEDALVVEPYTPTIAPRTRDVVYISGLVVTGAVAITVPTVSALAPDLAGVAAQIGTAVLSGVGLIVSGLGVAFRPGAGR